MSAQRISGHIAGPTRWARGDGAHDFYRMLVEEAADIVCYIAADTMDWISPAVERLLGWAPAELMGKAAADLWHPGDRPAFLALIRVARADGNAREILRARHRSGEYAWVEVSARPAAGTGLVAVVRDASHEVLAQSYEWYRVLSERASEVVFRGNREAVLEWVSVSATTILGRAPDAWVGHQLTEFVHPDDLDAALEAAAGADHAHVLDYTARFLHADGSWRWMAVVAHLLRDADGNTTGWVGSARDVTENRQVEQALQLAEQRFRWVAESITDVIFLTDLDAHVVWVSDSVERLLGYSPAQFKGIVGHDLAHPEDVDLARAVCERISAGEVVRERIRLRTAAGSHIWAEVTGSRILDEAGNLVGHLGSWHDVTKEQIQRDLLEDERARLSAILESELEPHVYLQACRDSSGVIVDFRCRDVNKAACAYTGRTRGQLEGAFLLDLLPDHLGPAILDLHVRAMESGQPIVLDNFSYPFEIEGVERRYDIRAAKVGDGLSCSWRDVTDRHEYAVALEHSQARLRLLAENAADVVMLFDSDDNAVWVSPSTHRLLGYEPAELLGPVPFGLLHPSDLSRAQEAVKALRSGQRLTVTQEVRMRRRDGRYRWWQATARRTADDGPGSDLVLALRDIELEVVAREAVAEEQRRRGSIIESMIDPYLLLRWQNDLSHDVMDFVVDDANYAARAAFGDPAAPLVGRRLRQAAPALKASEVFDPLLVALGSGEPLAIDDAPCVMPDGSAVWIDVRAVPLGTDRVSLTWRDVTERHASAQALAESEARFRLLAENLGDVLIALADDRRVTYASASAADLLGWNPDELVGTELLDLVHPDDRLAVTRCLHDSHRAEDGRASARLRIRRADGAHLWMGFVAREVRGPAGQAASAVVTMRDIHDQVLAESELHKEATTDALTGLMNRRELTLRVRAILARKDKTGLAVLFIDVDVLKTINDNHGHAAGDGVIAVVADRLRAAVRGYDLVARMGGDEFVVVLTGARTVEAALRVASRIHALMEAPVEVGGTRIRASLSIGVALVGAHSDPAVAFDRADAAMYQAKRDGRGRTAVSQD